jgi:hypothetical protein
VAVYLEHLETAGALKAVGRARRLGTLYSIENESAWMFCLVLDILLTSKAGVIVTIAGSIASLMTSHTIYVNLASTSCPPSHHHP